MYNGWENYETWLINSWIDEGCELTEALTEILQEDLDDYDTAKKFQNHVEGMNPLNGFSVWHDLIQSALDTVNWREIVENSRKE